MELQTWNCAELQTWNYTISRQNSWVKWHSIATELQMGQCMSCFVLMQTSAFMYCCDTEITDAMTLVFFLLLGWWSRGFKACEMQHLQHCVLWWCSCSQFSAVMLLCQVFVAFGPLHHRCQVGCWWVVFSWPVIHEDRWSWVSRGLLGLKSELIEHFFIRCYFWQKMFNSLKLKDWWENILLLFIFRITFLLYQEGTSKFSFQRFVVLK